MSATRKIAINARFAFIPMVSPLFGAETAATKMLKAKMDRHRDKKSTH
jgi:hypothetical protein